MGFVLSFHVVKFFLCGYFRSLVRHALTHIDPKERPKPYKCHYCGKEYTEVTGYKHHLRSVHTGEWSIQKLQDIKIISDLYIQVSGVYRSYRI